MNDCCAPSSLRNKAATSTSAILQSFAVRPGVTFPDWSIVTSLAVKDALLLWSGPTMCSNAENVDRRRERANRVRIANRILASFGIRLADWQGTSFVISTRTGKTEIISDLGHLWQAAERLSGKTCDPLNADIIAGVEAGCDD